MFKNRISKSCFKALFLLFFCMTCRMVGAQDDAAVWHSDRPDGHAPINIMGDHMHHKGEWMLSYRFMPMAMSGNLEGRNSVSNEKIFKNYAAAPVNMLMLMHMVGVMYAPTEHLTIMGMVNYLSNDMPFAQAGSTTEHMRNYGLGDVSVVAMLRMFQKKRHSMHMNVGLSLPTGSIREEHQMSGGHGMTTGAGGAANEHAGHSMTTDAGTMTTASTMTHTMSYPMQLGSGTVDPFVAITYLGQTDRFSWGAQLQAQSRIGTNYRNYRLGNQWQSAFWGAMNLGAYFSVNASMYYKQIGAIQGKDADISETMLPIGKAANSGRKQVDAGLGINFYVPSGMFKNNRIAVSATVPVYQEVSGIQMKNVWMLTAGYQITF